MRGLRALILTAWAVFSLDAVGVAWLALSGWLTNDALGRSIALGVAGLMAVPLVVLFAVLTVSNWRRSRIGLWICLALAVAPIILVIGNMMRHGA